MATSSAAGGAPLPSVKGLIPGDSLPLKPKMRKGGKKAKAMKGMKRRAIRKKKAAAAEEAPMKALRRK